MSTAQKNYYDLLGVSKEATNDEIRKAYRKLAKKYHPDKTGGDTEAEDRLKEINAAYDTLKNEDKRKEYDTQQAYGFGGGGAGGGGFEGFDFSGSGFEDIFSAFGGGRQSAQTHNAPRRGHNLETHVTISLLDVLYGTTKTIQLYRNETCGDCNGSGAAPGTSPITCPDCHGTGQVARSNGVFHMNQTCPRCHGTGSTVTTPCGACSGTGQVKAQRTISVTIPKGIQDGTRLRVAGEGEAGAHGGPHGDLFVSVTVASHPLFRRSGADIICEVPVTFATAALGGSVEVPTLDRKLAKLTVPAGTQHGTQLRMKGMGLPTGAGAKRGDELIQVAVEIPRKLNKEQKAMLAEMYGIDVPDSHPLMDKFKALLKSFLG